MDETVKPSLWDGAKETLFFWLQALAGALVVLILLFTFVGRIIVVDGNSMNPTLESGDYLLLRSIAYTPKQGDIVVLTKDFGSWTDTPIVKRVIAVGGQTVKIDYTQGVVYVDGVALEEDYILETMTTPRSSALSITEVTVPQGSVFVMGDNRNNSADSRHYDLGCVDERYILGEAVLVLWPLSNIGTL